MVDVSSLSAKQLRELLKKKEELESQDISNSSPENGDDSLDKSDDKDKSIKLIEPIKVLCKYKPIRANQKPCTEESNTEFGFCKAHCRTIQGKKAREIFELAKSSEKELSEASLKREIPQESPKNKSLKNKKAHISNENGESDNVSKDFEDAEEKIFEEDIKK